MNLPKPLELPDPSPWQLRKPLAWSAALAAVRYLPKGGGTVANWMGRTFLNSATFAVRVPSGSLLAVEAKNLAYYALLVAQKAQGQVETVNRCLAHLRPDSVFYDIGANAGYISLEAARRARLVVAFEPQPALSQTAIASVALNEIGNMIVYQVALGREEGLLDLFIPRFGIHASAVSREANAKRITCPLVPLDKLVHSGAFPPPTLLKVDVEGAELDVFSGAVETLRTHQPTLLFEADENLKRFGLTRKDLLEFLSCTAPYQFAAVVGTEKIPLSATESDKATDILAWVE